MLEYTPVEGMVLGSVLVAMGDGLVIPKMKAGLRARALAVPVGPVWFRDL